MTSREERLRRSWDRHAETYDQQMGAVERRFFGDTRPWVCGRAVGETLEVAVGTGLNLEHYPADLPLAGVEWSPSMLAVAVRRAERLGRPADLREADARALPYPDDRFDTVVSTFALCCIPDPEQALDEMARVLRPGGLLLLADHVESSTWSVRVLQRLTDLVTVPLQGERFCHRPLHTVLRKGFTLEAHDRLRLGMVERLAARQPNTPRSASMLSARQYTGTTSRGTSRVTVRPPS